MLLVHEFQRFSSWLDLLEPCRVATGRPFLHSVNDAVVAHALRCVWSRRSKIAYTIWLSLS